MKEKKILIVYPHNFLQGLHGTNMNIYQLVKIFKELNYKVDILGYEGFTYDSDFSNFEEQNKHKIVDSLYIYDFRKNNGLNRKSIITKIKNKIKFFEENKGTDKIPKSKNIKSFTWDKVGKKVSNMIIEDKDWYSNLI